MDHIHKLNILSNNKNNNLLITTTRNPEEKIFVERLVYVGILPYVKVTHDRFICVTEITKIRKDTSKQQTLYLKK